MKVTYNNTTKEDTFPFLARHNVTKAIVLVGKHSAIILEATKHGTIDGDGWKDIRNMLDLFTRLAPGESVTLNNE